MTRSISEAARDAVSGKDETLWRACCERAQGSMGIARSFGQADKVCEQAIRSMSPAELSLYDIEVPNER